MSALLCLVCAAGVGLEVAPARHLYDLEHGFKNPSDVAVSPLGRVYVVDGLNHQVQMFDAAGRFVSAFGGRGEGDGEMLFPLGIGLDGAGYVYVADTGNHRVQVFTGEGGFVASIDLPDVRGVPADPTDVVVMGKDPACYVVDNDHHRILEYDLASLRLLREMGGAGSRRGRLFYPFLLAGNGRQLLVVEVLNSRVQVLTARGEFEAFIGDWGIKSGLFYRPKGIALDAAGRVYVSDSYLGVIQVFDSTGRFQRVVGEPGRPGPKRFLTPMGLAVDGLNRLYVVEMTANRVGVHQLPGTGVK